MKKIIYILVALGLVLGLTVVATPAMANVSNVTVVPGSGSTLVECGCSNWTITFTTNLALSQYQKIYLRFPAGSDLSSTSPCGSVPATLTVEWYNPLTASWVPVAGWSTAVYKYGDKTQQLHLTAPAGGIWAGQLRIAGIIVSNPTAGTYTIMASTEREPTEVASDSFTILAGPTVTPASTVWCVNSCTGIEFQVNWGASCANNIVNLMCGTVNLTNKWKKVDVALGVSNYTISCGNLSACNWSPCAPALLEIQFAAGCNETIAVTVANSTAITLIPGWNLISLPLIPLNSDITKIFGPPFLNATEAKKVVSVWTWENACQADGTGAWKVYKDGTGFQSLTTMDYCKSYWVCINATTGNLTLPLCGFKYPCPPAVPPKCCYCECWNMVGFLSTKTMPLGNYTFSLPAGALQACLTYNSTGWHVVNNATTMVPGQGYWMSFGKDTCLVPPVS